MDANKNGWVFNVAQPDISVKENDDGQFTLVIVSENGCVNDLFNQQINGQDKVVRSLQ